MAKFPRRLDPSRTAALRKAFEAEVARRFAALRKAVRKLIVDDDVFGLKPDAKIAFNIERQAWRFRTDDMKHSGFNKWFQNQVDADVLSVDTMGDRNGET